MKVLNACFLLATTDRHGDGIPRGQASWRTRTAVAAPKVSSSPLLPLAGRLYGSTTSSTPPSASPDAPTTPTSPPSPPWAKHALLISSYSDGVLKSPDAQMFLKAGLAEALAADNVRRREEAVRESVMYSPCAGPDVGLLDALESADEAASVSTSARMDSRAMGEAADETIRRILRSASKDMEEGGSDDPPGENTHYCRLLYIPTAMYALNPASKNTPGKQRQRARADGKKRRTVVSKHVHELLLGGGDNGGDDRFQVLAVTLDLDDGSVKQPSGSDDPTLFPKDGREALQSWAPHLVYVEGGNTFWLQHCLEEGNWVDDLRSAVTGPDGAVYCGKSAGAIVAGCTVETATWKGWDDPAVVPGMETYDDWKGHRGVGLVGGASFFPHMSEEWESLVGEKLDGMNDEDAASSVYCLREWEACCVSGDRGEAFVNLVSGEH